MSCKRVKREVMSVLDSSVLVVEWRGVYLNGRCDFGGLNEETLDDDSPNQRENNIAIEDVVGMVSCCASAKGYVRLSAALQAKLCRRL